MTRRQQHSPFSSTQRNNKEVLSPSHTSLSYRFFSFFLSLCHPSSRNPFSVSQAPVSSTLPFPVNFFCLCFLFNFLSILVSSSVVVLFHPPWSSFFLSTLFPFFLSVLPAIHSFIYCVIHFLVHSSVSKSVMFFISFPPIMFFDKYFL